jgi:hypothetical protein
MDEVGAEAAPPDWRFFPLAKPLKISNLTRQIKSKSKASTFSLHTCPVPEQKALPLSPPML